MADESLTFQEAVDYLWEQEDWGEYEFTDKAEMVAHIRNTLRLPEEPPVLGSWEIHDDGSKLSHAYKVILTPPEEVPEPTTTPKPSVRP